MIRFATIGTNSIVNKFLESAGKCPELSHTAVYSRTEEKAKDFAARHKAPKFYTSLEKMAEDSEIDAVYIASPNCFHCEQSILMMEHGKHVLCEKPVASNSQELALMLAAAEKNHVVFLEAMRSIFDPGFEALRSQLPRLGAIRRMTFQYCQYSSRYDKFKNGIIENAFRPELSNGALMDIGVYCVHALVKLFGMPENIRAQAVFLNNGVDGAGTILAGYPDKQAEIIYSKITNSSLPSQIQGEEGNLLIREIPDITELTFYPKNGTAETISIEKEKNNMYYEAKEWARLILEGGSTRDYNLASVMELAVMDEARKQLGIVFPADKK